MAERVVTAEKGDGLRAALRLSRVLIVWAIVFSAGVNLLYLAPSIYMMQVYDRVLATGGLGTLALVSVVLVFALVTLVTLDAMRSRLLVRISARLERQLAPRLLEAGLRSDVRDSRPRLALRAFDSLRQVLSGPAASAVMDAPWAPIYLIACFLIHPLVGVVVTLGGAALLALAVRNERAVHGMLEQSAELAPRVHAAQEADAANAEAARALGMRRALIDRQLAGRAALDDLAVRSAVRIAHYAGFSKFLRLMLQSAALAVGAYLAVERQISPGALIACSILASRALQPLEQIVGAWRQIGQARLNYAAVNEALAGSPPAPERTSLPAPRGELRFERVSLRAPAGQRLLLADISFVAGRGEALGIVGPSGAGKSTLARIAAGALTPDAGLVRLDAANFTDWDGDQLGAHVGYLPQDVGLLAGTVADNIRRFQPKADAGDGAVIAAATAAGAHEMILRLPLGYETLLEGQGRGLSMGQAQRIALARALFGRPALLVLDEPNAHQDAEGEAALFQAISAARARGATVIVVAHRAGLIEAMDRLAVMREGKIELIGSREDVLRRLSPEAVRTPVRVQEALR